MLMADTMAIFFVILGLLLAFPGLWLLCRGLWPRAVAGAAAICGKGLIKSFVVGMPVTAAMIFLAAVMSRFGGAGKIASAVMICLYLMIANCGVAGLAAVVGERLASPAGKMGSEAPWRVTLRGGVAIGLASLLPILGWFVILPVSMMVGCGANLLSLLRTGAASRDQLNQAIGAPAEAQELRVTSILDASALDASGAAGAKR
jgi:hypothetical protein